VIKSKEQNPSTQVKRITLKKLIKRISAEEKHIIIPQQIHGNGCLTIKKGDELKRKYKGDAILTDRKDIFLTVSVADCLPIFLVEPKRKVVGLVHAGWRGTLLGIAKETIRKAQKEFGCKSEDFTLLFGPAIQKCCYEISELMAILFDEDGLTRIPGEKPKLDLMKINLKQFLSCGVKRKKIFATNDCTCCNKDMFHSFRRDGDKAGRMIAFIGIK
ncbi:MAG: peptidoglycan editing factor PgeF, partial [candidate division Zixibacteria bacterium]|nr:peptidoglycan editing factor PgeF [candidate division Zixibacteria bacterium]